MFANAGIDLTETIQFYATVNLARSTANQSFNYRPSQTATGLVVDVGTGTPQTRTNNRNGSFNTIFLTRCPVNNATCPADGFVQDTNTFSFASIYPAGFTPRFIGKVSQNYGTLGFKGEFDGGLTYDLSGTIARNELSLSMTDSLSASFGPQSQTSFFFGDLIQREQNFNLDLTYPLEVGFASAITLSGGAELRREEYEKTVGDLQSYAAGPFARQPLYVQTAPGVFTPARNADGSQTVATQSPAASGYGGVSPVFAGVNSQESYGVYLGAEADITDAFTMGLAARFEDYETFGNTIVWKANALYEVSPVFSVRATIGTGFHAPSPGQNNTQIVTTNFRGGNQVQTGTYPVTSSIAQYYGSTSLQPEKSNNYGAGFIVKPLDNLTLTVDGYIIDVRDRIGISQTFTVTAADLAALPALSIVGVGGDVNYFTNGFDTTTRGVDAVANYRTRLLDGGLNLTLAYSYNESEVTEFNPSVISAAQRFNIANLPPKHRLNASGNWQWGDFQVNARVNYFSSWANQLEYPGQTFSGKATADLDFSYTLADHFTLTVGANNIFDTYPDRIAPSTTNPIYALTNSLADGQIYPRSGGPFGINGGFYYARIRVVY
jgi:iron complex outermembrane receptor protein